MEKICGFLDKNNNFHKTEKDCEKANLRINIREIENSLDTFSSRIQQYIFRDRNWNHHIDSEYRFHRDKIEEIVANAVLFHSKEFISIINSKKEMEKTLDLLRKEKEYKDKWWIKIVWWK